MKRFTKNRLLIFLISTLLLACSNENLNISAHKNIVEVKATKQVRFIGQWLNEGKRGKLVKDFCKQYEFKNQEVFIDLRFPEELFEDWANRESNVRVVGELLKKEKPEWDIIRLNNQYNAILQYSNDSLWAKNHLVDFSQIPEYRDNTSPKLLTEESKRAYGGIIPGPFLEGSYWALWSNKKVADKVGITIKSKGMTFDDFLGYLKAVNAYNKQNPNDYIVPLHEASDWQTLFALVYQLFTTALNSSIELYNKGEIDNKLQAWNKTLKALEELSVLKPFDPSWRKISWEESNCDLINGKCLFYINGSWMYNIWESKDAVKVRDAFPNEMPAFNDAFIYPSAYFITWGVLKNSPNRDEAVKLLLAMNKPDIAEMWVQYTKCPSGIKGRLTDLSFGSDQFENFSNYIQNKYQSNIYNYSEEVSENIIIGESAASIFYREVVTGELTADEAMELIKNKI